MENINKTAILAQINEALKFDTDETKAVAYGISWSDEKESLECQVISSNADIYDLIDNLSDFSNASSFDYLSIITWGWAAPLDSDGDIDGAPSKHPQKRRVKLIISGSNIEKGLIGSVINFSDDPDEPIYDYGDATGSLNDAFIEFFKGE
jgi:hypothetical protein